MSEADVIATTARPVTVSSLLSDLRALGVSEGDVLIVHSRMSSLGWVAGGPQAVVEALLAAVGPSGTVVMPTQSAQLSDPAGWSNPPVPAEWVDIIRAETSAYDPDMTPTRGMGQVVECFRTHPATIRSSHPTLSFAANGPAAHQIIDGHPLTPGFGEGSPLSRLYDLDATVVLLGADHGSNTSLHLAEHRADWPSKSWSSTGAPMLVDGVRHWVTYDDLDLDADDFVAIGDAFAATGGERCGSVGGGTTRLSSMREIVDFAVAWMAENRASSTDPTAAKGSSPADFYTGIVARIYRHLRGHQPDPEPYARFIARSGQPALELGCGDGDPLLDLRALGLDVEGLDASADMLDGCRVRAATRGIEVVLHEATFESMELGRRFRSIYLAGATFNLLPNDDAMYAALERIVAHLEPGGSALVPLFVPTPLEEDAVGVQRETTVEDGVVMRFTTLAAERDETARRQTTLLRYELDDGDGIQSIERPWIVHWVEQERFAEMAERAGFTVSRVIGPSGAPATPDDTTFTFLLRIVSQKP